MESLSAGSAMPDGNTSNSGSKRKPRMMPDSLIRALMAIIADSMRVGTTLSRDSAAENETAAFPASNSFNSPDAAKSKGGNKSSSRSS